MKLVKEINSLDTILLDRNRTIAYFDTIHDADNQCLFWANETTHDSYIKTEWILTHESCSYLFMKKNFYRALAKHNIDLHVIRGYAYHLYFVFDTEQAKLQFLLEAL